MRMSGLIGVAAVLGIAIPASSQDRAGVEEVTTPNAVFECVRQTDIQMRHLRVTPERYQMVMVGYCLPQKRAYLNQMRDQLDRASQDHAISERNLSALDEMATEHFQLAISSYTLWFETSSRD